MTETTTTKPVNPYQLGQEMGGAALRIVGPDEDGNTKVRSDVAQATLDAKVAAHVADPNVKPPPSVEPGNEASLRQQMRDALVANRAFKAQAKPGTAAAQASSTYDQAKALTRQMNGVLRLLLGDLSGTD